jgi:hypothetical protein
METKNVYIQPKIEQKCQAHNLKVVYLNSNPLNIFLLNPAYAGI